MDSSVRPDSREPLATKLCPGFGVDISGPLQKNAISIVTPVPLSEKQRMMGTVCMTLWKSDSPKHADYVNECASSYPRKLSLSR